MNMSPQDVDRMSMWQFFAMVEGMTDKEEGALSVAEADEIWDWLKVKDGN